VIRESNPFNLLVITPAGAIETRHSQKVKSILFNSMKSNPTYVAFIGVIINDYFCGLRWCYHQRKLEEKFLTVSIG
jgi:hypothetical protein